MGVGPSRRSLTLRASHERKLSPLPLAIHIDEPNDTEPSQLDPGVEENIGRILAPR